MKLVLLFCLGLASHLGVDAHGGGQLPAKTHSMFASLLEEYSLSGKAPSLNEDEMKAINKLLGAAEMKVTKQNATIHQTFAEKKAEVTAELARELSGESAAVQEALQAKEASAK